MEMSVSPSKQLYTAFFVLCQKSTIGEIEDFLLHHDKNEKIDINYRNEHGITALLHVATWGRWDVVRYLLSCGADKMIPDKYGQTVFSKAVYWKLVYSTNPLKELLCGYYSVEEINQLCREIGFDRGVDYQIVFPVDTFVQDVLDDIKSLEAKNEKGNTALHEVCLHAHIPHIIQLIERGASLDAENEEKHTPYDELKGTFTSIPTVSPFVIREAFNRGSSPIGVPIEVFRKLPQARLWGKVWQEARDIAKLPPDQGENESIIHLLNLPKEDLTKVNVQLALKGI